jgi:rubrerythrin
MKNKALAFALDVEAQGTQMYLQLAAKATNALAKLLFYSLAEKEVDHARRFDTLYAQIIDKKSKPTVSASQVGILERN